MSENRRIRSYRKVDENESFMKYEITIDPIDSMSNFELRRVNPKMPEENNLIMAPGQQNAMPVEELERIKKIADKEIQILSQPQFKIKLKLETKARVVIKEKLEARIKRGLPNDWKIDFYKTKLERNFAITKKLRSLIKK